MGRTRVKIYLRDRKEQIANILSKSKSLASALLTGEDVGLAQMEKRLEVCNDCEHADKSDPKGLRCGICSCKIKVSERSLINLARYKETAQYGCKDPRGSRWKANGV